ncbi:testis-specific protein 10-interacting protein isoform X3 [Monodelphis domestica]|uniref:testis-specific protein 10-interacting protein isoform X3 n=1 Tax=Monodelphis domestica TaxID=13616 RepID=UPI0024E27414|nr:testis-specific protein 10-interacting protein isoform X3 [Monodelphis domestica]
MPPGQPVGLHRDGPGPKVPTRGDGTRDFLPKTHQQSILATSAVKSNQDARVRVSSASSEKATAAGLLGLLSGVPVAHQGTFGSGDAVLIQGRPRARSAGNIRKKDAAMGKGKKGNEPSEAEDLIPPRPRKPSFPFQWAWESFLVDGRSLATASPNSSHHTSQPKKAQTAGLPPARVPRKSRWKAVPPAAQPVNFPLYWKMEARCRDIRKQLKTWIDPEVCFQEMQEMQDSQDGQEQGQQEDQDGRGEEGPEAKQEFYPSSVLPEKRWKSKKLGTRTKTREEAEAVQGPVQDVVQPQAEKRQAWEDVKSFLPMGSTTKTFQKRQEATRALMLDWERQQREERARAEQRQAQAHRIRKKLARCLAAYGPSRSKESGASNRKLDELRQQEKQRLAEYKAELQGIHQRVQNRPFLFQQAMQNNARLSVNRRFSQVLSALGLDEDQLLAEALKDDIEEVPPKRRSSKSRKLARIRMEQPL